MAEKLHVKKSTGAKLLFEPGLIKAAENENLITNDHNEIVQESDNVRWLYYVRFFMYTPCGF